MKGTQTMPNNNERDVRLGLMLTVGQFVVTHEAMTTFLEVMVTLKNDPRWCPELEARCLDAMSVVATMDQAVKNILAGKMPGDVIEVIRPTVPPVGPNAS
jgi:hypothetical protein